MKRAFKKTLCMLLLLLTLFNFIYLPKSNATSGAELGITNWELSPDGLLDGVAGVLTSPVRIIGLTIGSLARNIAAEIADVGDAKNDKEAVFLDLEDIFFHNVNGNLKIIDINFFEEDSGTGVIGDIRKNIAGWYYAIRNLAIIISLLVLIYIGIRMAISTLAEDKAKYKKMITDWVVGFITIFLLHYIIIATIYINEALVTAIKPSGNDGFMGSYLDSIWLIGMDLTTSFTTGIAATVVFTFMTVLVFMYLFAYIKRMLTIAFLIIIAPIITVTYSIDKIGDGKSQALNTWLKEFIYNVLIQPFHCIIYMVFATVLIDLLTSTASIGNGVIAIIIMLFMRQAEGIVKNIFGFGGSKSLGDAFAAGALLLSSMKTATSALSSVKGGSGSKGGSGKSGSGSSSGSSGKKPQVKDTSNVGNPKTTSNTSSNSTSSPRPSSSSTSGRGSSKSSSGENSTSTSTSRSEGASNSSQNTSSSAGEKSYNIAPVKGENKFGAAVKKIAASEMKGLEMAMGIGIGGALSGDVTAMMAAKNFTSTAFGASKALGGKAITGAKGLANFVTRKSRITGKTNNVIDAYNDLKSEKGWDNDRMLSETERVLEIKDTNRIKDEKLRKYAETVQDLRTEYDGRYQAPNDMVLDRVTKIQSGEVKKNPKKRYTRPKTKPTNNN